MRITQSVVLITAVLVAACGGGTREMEPAATNANDKLVIYTVNYPLAYFAERIGGDLVEVHLPVPRNEDPAFWSPDADTIAAYQGADLILLNGAGYAKWVDRAALPSSRVINTSEGFTDKLLRLEGTVTHSHGPEGEHEHAGYAFTTWLDPGLAILQAQTVAGAISVLRPDEEPEIGQRLESLKSNLLDIDGRLAFAAEALGDEPLLFSHPVYQYLIKRYGLNGVEIHWEPDQVPGRNAWDHLESLLERHHAKWILWEGEPLEATIRGLEDRGIYSLVFDPCGNQPEEGDYLSVMAANAVVLENLAASIR
jgi:zinc transport system substrate-binding protein